MNHLFSERYINQGAFHIKMHLANNLRRSLTQLSDEPHFELSALRCGKILFPKETGVYLQSLFRTAHSYGGVLGILPASRMVKD